MKKIVGKRAKVSREDASKLEPSFAEVMDLIRSARQTAFRSVNRCLIDLYWRVGKYLDRKIAVNGWAKGTVVQLAAYISRRQPGLRGFSPQNLWRMRQFYAAYRGEPKLSTLLRELPWSSHRKPHENPSIGILLCASKDDEVVEYALGRSLSPALVAEYRTRLPDKKLLAAKLREFYSLNVKSKPGAAEAGTKARRR